MEAYAQPCVYERYPGAASAARPRTYRQRQPQSTVLHRVVREHLLSFLAEGVERSASGEGYPYYVEKEFRSFISCGDLSRGFARVRCGTCGHELLLPFACKNRGVCPSCTARRMSDEAAYLVDMVLPEAPYRQWTLTFPFVLRFLMARDHALITAVLGVALRLLFAWQRRCAKRAGHAGAKTAAVAFVQRFGGALNCNVHAHVLLPDGVFVLGQGDETFSFVRLPPPEDGDILRLTHTLARRVTALLERRFGTLEAGADNVLEGAIGEGMQPVRTLPTDAGSAEDDAPDEHPAARTRRRAASVDGFSIHAATAVPAHNRVGLEKLCRYGMRPAFSHERLSLSASGHVLCGLRRPWPTAGGVSVLSFEPVAFLRRLAPLIPPPWAHLVRHYGLFAPNAKGRDLLPAAPVSPDSIRIDVQLRADRSRLPPRTQDAGPASSERLPDLPTASPPHPALRPLAAVAPIAPETASAPSAASSATQNRRRVLPWSQLLRRVFLCDVLGCARCGGSMTVIAYLTDVVVVDKILAHLGLPTSPPSLSPARLPAQVEMFEDVTTDRACSDRPRRRRSRAPPWAENDADASPATDPATDSGDWGA